MTQELTTITSQINEFISVKGIKWLLKNIDERNFLTIKQKYNLCDFTSRILCNKKININEVSDFLEPKLRNLLQDPFHLLDMDKATDRIIQAIKKKQKIAIYGDYDVDGATSSALLKRFFLDIGIITEIYIPDRIKEGYGPNEKAFDYLKSKKTDLIITVDCGTLSHKPLSYAKKLGIDVIVIDHHIGDTILPDALAIVNPNRIDEKSEYSYLAAVGVSFLLTIAINIKLKEINFFTNLKEPNLISLLDLVALGTICDVVPLIGLNRALVIQGLKILSKRTNIGLSILSDISGIKEKHNTYHLGYLLGPRINAGGRVGESFLGSALLSTNNYTEAETIAYKLDKFNAERKAIEISVMEEAAIKAENCNTKSVIIVYGENWHPGVIGIVAGRLKEQYNKPIAVISIVNGIGKASCRSIKGVDFGTAIINAKLLGIIEEGGGHAMAAGFTINKDKIEELVNFLENKFSDDLQKISDLGSEYFDSYLTIKSLTPDFISRLEKLSPFGAGNPEPKFMLTDVIIIKYNQFGDSHISCILKDTYTGITIKANAFREQNTIIGQTIINSVGKKIAVIGYARINNWNGNSNPEFLICDII